MREFKILHLYSQALDLYGDYSNPRELCRRLAQLGHSATIHCCELGDALNPAPYDLIYIGHGKAKNLAAVAPHFVQYGELIREYVEAGGLFLAVGNSRLLFGREFETIGGTIQKGIGLFDYVGRELGTKSMVSDVLAHPVFAPQATTYGFINRTSYLEGENPHPLFEVVRGLGDGERQLGPEGTLYKNFFATWQLGPILLRNPVVLNELLGRMLGEQAQIDTELADRALELTVSALQKA